jgi:hypothetical protein
MDNSATRIDGEARMQTLARTGIRVEPFSSSTRLPFARQAEIVLDQMKRCLEAAGHAVLGRRRHGGRSAKVKRSIDAAAAATAGRHAIMAGA